MLQEQNAEERTVCPETLCEEEADDAAEMPRKDPVSGDPRTEKELWRRCRNPNLWSDDGMDSGDALWTTWESRQQRLLRVNDECVVPTFLVHPLVHHTHCVAPSSPRNDS